MAAKKDDSPVVKFKFSRLWSSDRGYFAVGDEADLPQDIAESLEVESVGEIVKE